MYGVKVKILPLLMLELLLLMVVMEVVVKLMVMMLLEISWVRSLPECALKYSRRDQ